MFDLYDIFLKTGRVGLVTIFFNWLSSQSFFRFLAFWVLKSHFVLG